MQISCTPYVDEEYLEDDFDDELEEGTEGSSDDELFQDSWYIDEEAPLEVPVIVCGYCHECGWYFLIQTTSQPDEPDPELLSMIGNLMVELHRYENVECDFFEIEVIADRNCS
jgi:hypothetical protein